MDPIEVERASIDVRRLIAYAALIAFVLFTTIGFTVKAGVGVGMIAFGLTSGVAAYLLGNE